MSSSYYIIPIIIGLLFCLWLIKSEAKDFFVYATFAQPEFFRHVPYVYNQASRLLIEQPQDYIQRHPSCMVHTLEALADSDDLRVRYRAMQAIVDNIGALAKHDEGEAAAALLSVINKSDSNSATHHRALQIRPAIIDNMAESDPVQAVLVAQRGIVLDEDGDGLHSQSCELALKHLDHAFRISPIVAAHAACNIARKTHGKTREAALWMVLSHINIVTEADFESGHAAAEQAVLLGTLETPLHKAALGMWEWYIQRILTNNPSSVIDKMFFGFGISTAPVLNKCDLHEHGFDFLLKHPDIIADHPEETIRVALSIGLRTAQNTRLYHMAVDIWTKAVQELCKQDLHQAIQAANDAMTFTSPGSQFERQAQMAYCHLRKLDDDIAHQSQMVFSQR